MILTGKAKRNFNKWLLDKYTKTIHTLNITEQYAYIIEWFDSVLIGEVCLWDYVFMKSFTESPKSKVLEIQQKAIVKANEIYNETHK